MEEDWIRCNKCYRDINDSTKPFTLTQCLHVYCKNCIVAGEKKCLVCGSVDVPTVPLTKSLLQRPTSDKLYFGPKLSDDDNHAIQVSRVIDTQASIIFKRFEDMEQKSWSLKDMIEKAMKEKESMEAACKELEEELASEERLLKIEQEEWGASNLMEIDKPLVDERKIGISSAPSSSWAIPAEAGPSRLNRPSVSSTLTSAAQIGKPSIQFTPHYSMGNTQMGKVGRGDQTADTLNFDLPRQSSYVPPINRQWVSSTVVSGQIGNPSMEITPYYIVGNTQGRATVGPGDQTAESNPNFSHKSYVLPQKRRWTQQPSTVTSGRIEKPPIQFTTCYDASDNTQGPTVAGYGNQTAEKHVVFSRQSSFVPPQPPRPIPLAYYSVPQRQNKDGADKNIFK